VPFELVIALFAVVPPLPTATNKPISEDHAIEFHEIAAITVRGVQVVPFELVITLFVVVPPLATAAKRASSGAHAIAFHEIASVTV